MTSYALSVTFGLLGAVTTGAATVTMAFAGRNSSHPRRPRWVPWGFGGLLGGVFIVIALVVAVPTS
ncbi:hypothetical protein [Amycolatopsis sp. NPDC051903]|uniref:hypothetical protein n=1 Tax=Amycolatopsis sp. NPDC051903 TaxID=3363936 RepID=UPI00379162B5